MQYFYRRLTVLGIRQITDNFGNASMSYLMTETMATTNAWSRPVEAGQVVVFSLKLHSKVLHFTINGTVVEHAMGQTE